MKIFRNTILKICFPIFMMLLLWTVYSTFCDIQNYIENDIVKISSKNIYIQLIKEKANENDFAYIDEKEFIDMYNSIDLENGYIGITDSNMNVLKMKDFDIKSNIDSNRAKEIVTNNSNDICFYKNDFLYYKKDFRISNIIETGIKDLSMMRGIYFYENGDACIISFSYLNTIEPYYLTEFYPLDNYKSLIIDFMIKNYFERYFLWNVIVLVLSYIVASVVSKKIKEFNRTAESVITQKEQVSNKKDDLSLLTKNINHIVNELKTTKKDLKIELERVKKLESTRKEFIANFTHEIKTPLAVINGNLELLENTNDELRKEKYIKTINCSIDKINILINQMLNLSKLESDIIELNNETFMLEDLVLDILDSNEALLLKKNIKINYTSYDNIIITADRYRLGIVINNFLTNAIKHSKNDNEIIIKMTDTEFSIFNYGSPIEEDKINNIWLSFVSYDNEGTGLGLAISKEFLKIHNFHYGVRNKEDGVEFYFQF